MRRLTNSVARMRPPAVERYQRDFGIHGRRRRAGVLGSGPVALLVIVQIL